MSNNTMSDLGDRMKSYEKAEYTRIGGDYVLHPNIPFLARIDGHTFSKFTNGFEKPYDLNISQAMIRTTADLVKKGNVIE